MEQQEYLIGDIAEITGLSRDTLRFYEKKGILNARKKANGYRYFTEDDLYLLVRILFSRKMNLGLDCIEEHLSLSSLESDYQKTIRRQAKEEMKAIQSHKQALNRLLCMGKIFDQAGDCLNRFRVKPFPDSRICYRFKSPSEALRQWFWLSQKYQGMDMVYIYDCYQYQSGFSLKTDQSRDLPDTPDASHEYEAELVYRYSSLVLYQEVLEAMEPEYDFSEWEAFSGETCIHTIVEATDPKPEVSLICSMRTWGSERNLLAGSKVLVTSNLSRMKEEGPVYGQEIYIPLLVMESKGFIY